LLTTRGVSFFALLGIILAGLLFAGGLFTAGW
jgi:hypothetical protein